jgi:hypothetical protein
LETLRGLFYYKDGQLFNKVNRHKNAKDTPIKNRPNGEGYIHLEIKGRVFKAHRIIYALCHGYFPEEVDHINGIKEDNRIENLRGCTHQENSYNILAKKGVSGVQGVSKFGDKWRVRLGYKGKRISLGLYDDLELAELVAQEARDKYHGEFQNTERASRGYMPLLYKEKI